MGLYCAIADSQLGAYLNKLKTTGAHLVLANWSVEKKSWWEGYGLSRVVRQDGTLVTRASRDLGDAIVLADLPLAKE